MEMYGNEIKVQQGEDWNLDILLSANQVEYIPYIISSARANPFFVVTIASTKYEKNLRYVKSWWNDITKSNDALGQPIIPTFYQTVPQYVGELNSTDVLPTLPVNETYATRALYQYTLADEEEDIELGHKPYHYYYFKYKAEVDEEENVTMVPDGRVDGYECRIRFNFSSKETANWGSQDYLYQITLVSGRLMDEVLESIALDHDMPYDWPEGIEAQYKYVKVQWPNELQPDIDPPSPGVKRQLGYIEAPEVIVAPTRLQVFNNLRRLI